LAEVVVLEPGPYRRRAGCNDDRIGSLLLQDEVNYSSVRRDLKSEPYLDSQLPELIRLPVDYGAHVGPAWQLGGEERLTADAPGFFIDDDAMPPLRSDPRRLESRGSRAHHQYFLLNLGLPPCADSPFLFVANV